MTMLMIRTCPCVYVNHGWLMLLALSLILCGLQTHSSVFTQLSSTVLLIASSYLPVSIHKAVGSSLEEKSASTMSPQMKE